MRVTIDKTMPTETLRLTDADSFYLLEHLRWSHHGAFELHDEARREMPAGGWVTARFIAARQRLPEAGFLIAVNTNARHVAGR